MESIKFKEQNVVLGESQPEYNDLPALKTKEGIVVTCWELTLRERIRLFFKNKLWVSLQTFNDPLQPIFITTKKTDILN